MIKKMLRSYLNRMALEQGKMRTLWIKFCGPNNVEYAEFLRRHGGFHAMGTDCRINCGVVVTDPSFLRLGNNITLSTCTIIGHDASVGVIGRATGKKLDSVGKVDIRDNVFVGIRRSCCPE